MQICGAVDWKQIEAGFILDEVEAFSDKTTGMCIHKKQERYRRYCNERVNELKCR